MAGSFHERLKTAGEKVKAYLQPEPDPLTVLEDYFNGHTLQARLIADLIYHVQSKAVTLMIQEGVKAISEVKNEDNSLLEVAPGVVSLGASSKDITDWEPLPAEVQHLVDQLTALTQEGIGHGILGVAFNSLVMTYQMLDTLYQRHQSENVDLDSIDNKL